MRLRDHPRLFERGPVEVRDSSTAIWPSLIQSAPIRARSCWSNTTTAGNVKCIYPFALTEHGPIEAHSFIRAHSSAASLK